MITQPVQTLLCFVLNINPTNFILTPTDHSPLLNSGWFHIHPDPDHVTNDPHHPELPDDHPKKIKMPESFASVAPAP